MKELLSLLLVLFIAMPAAAYDFEVGGIYYDKNNDGKSLTVTYKDTETKYSGSVSIPSEVTVEGTKYSVTAIGTYAFKECADPTMVSLPNSLTVIDQYAFQSCSGLSLIDIPNSLTSINDYAFTYSFY